MKLALVLLGATSVVADCIAQATISMSDPSFNWLVSGSSADRKGNVTAICASPSNPARDSFDAKLNTFRTACVPPGGETSAIGLTLALLSDLLCDQQSDADGSLHYCVLSLLPLFDFSYFLQLSQAGGGSYPAPPLQPVGDSPDRQNAMCASSMCNAHVESMASALLANTPPASPLAADFIRNVVSRARCGCAVEQIACENTATTNALITTDGSGARTFIAGQACEANGVLTACARTWVNCEHVPLPACAVTCAPAGHNLANITFRIKNLDYTCLQAQLTNNVLQTIQSDVIVNVAGLLQSDFSCTCGAATGTTGTQCNCLITCASLSLVRNLNLQKSLVNLTNHAAALVIPTPNLDKQVIASCQISQNNESFGSSFEIVSLESNFPETSASSTLVGFSVAASICLSLVL